MAATLIALVCFSSIFCCTHAADEPKEYTQQNLLQLKVSLDESSLTKKLFPVNKTGWMMMKNIAQEIKIGSNDQIFGEELLGIIRATAIKKKNPEIEGRPLISLFILHWMIESQETPTPYKFIEVLRGIELSELADEMTTTYKILNLMDEPYTPSAVNEYAKLLSRNYEKESVIGNMPWLSRRLDEQNIKVSFIEDLELKEQDGSNISLSKLIANLHYGARILLWGRPGVGKTTIMRHLAKTLASSTKRFYLVIKVHLTTVVGKLDSLYALLHKADEYKVYNSESKEYIYNITSEFINSAYSAGQGVCILLDGLDEYAAYQTDGDYLAELVKSQLTQSVVITTSRLSIPDQQSYFHRKIEIMGFSESNIGAYLQQLSVSSNNTHIIHQYLNIHPNVKQLCYLPLHLSMLVYIVTGRNATTIPLVDTETKLYKRFLSLTIRQYQEDRKHKYEFESLENCFFKARHNDYDHFCILIKKISEIAFNGVLNDEHAFNSSSFGELEKTFNDIPAELNALSLFKIEECDNEHDTKINKYYYSHPSFQEFLAALYLITKEKEIPYPDIYLQRAREMYKFFIGLTRMYNKEAKFSDMLSKMSFEVPQLSYNIINPYRNFLIMILAYEMASGQPSNFVAHLKATNVISPNYSVSLYHDSDNASYYCWYIGYLLVHSPLYSVKVISENIGACLLFVTNYFKQANISSSAVLNVTELKLRYHSYLPQNLHRVQNANFNSELMDFLLAFQNCLKCLEINGLLFQNGEDVLQLQKVLSSFKQLQSLKLSFNVINQHFETALESFSHVKHLQLYIFNQSQFSNDLLEFIKPFKHLANLKRLTMTLHRVNGANEMLEGVQKASSIAEIHLHLKLCRENGLINITAEELITALRNICGLKNLSLCIEFPQGNESMGMIEFARGLKQLSHLYLLNFELHIQDANESAIAVLVDAIKHLHELRFLEFQFSTAKQDKYVVAEVAKLFLFLTDLYEFQFEAGSEFKKPKEEEFFRNLKYLHKLKKLSLSHIELNDTNMIELVEALKNMSNLTILILSDNFIGDMGTDLLVEVIISHLYNLEVLNLNYNKLTCVGYSVISETRKRLHKLHIILNHEFTCVNYIVQLEFFAPVLTEFFIVCCLFFVKFILSTVADINEPESARMGVQDIVPVDINEADSTIKTQGAIAQALRFLTASSAWKLERLRNQVAGLDGSGTVIAILDTAVDVQCLGKEVQQVDNCLPSKPLKISFGHGTVCAAIADGVAPKAQLIVYQVSADGESFDKAAILQALDRILVKIMDNDFIDVVSMSFDFNEDDEGKLYRRIKALADLGVVLVAAAGNSGRYQSQAAIPARFKEVISVGALDENGDQSRFNGCGIIDVYAPGENILIEQISSTAFEGTSYATPAVAGLVALLKQLYAQHVLGPPTSQWICHVEILKRIFENDMMFRPDNGEANIFDPFRYFKERAHLLKDNVAKYAQELGLTC